MNASVVRALVAKDLSLYFRNRFFALITVLGLVFYAIVFFLMPSVVNETVKLGVYGEQLPPGTADLEFPGLEIQIAETDEALQRLVLEGEVVAGLTLPRADAVGGAEPVQVEMYVAAGTPDETIQAIDALFVTLLDALNGEAPSVVLSEQVIGIDLAGRQIPPRDRLRPLLAILLIMVETMGMASLISSEIVRGTIRALLVTPVSKFEFFLAKGITGTTLALGQAVLLMAIIGGISTQPLVVLVALLLGSVMVTGIGFVLATLGRDMLTVMVWGMLALVVLSIPSISIMFPGVASGWIEAIPTYYLVTAIDLSMNFNLGFDAVWDEMLALLAFDAAALAVGVAVLRRKAL